MNSLLIASYCLFGFTSPTSPDPSLMPYHVYVNGVQFHSPGPNVAWEFCAENGETKQIEVRLVNDDGTEAAEKPIRFEVRPQGEVPLAVRFDADNSGRIGIADFGLFVQSFGKCRVGMEEKPCE